MIRSVLVGPGGTRSGWGAAVGRTALVTTPASVRTVSRTGTGRAAWSSSSVTPIEPGSTMRWSKVIWTHCPTAVVGLASDQTVLGLLSNTLTGSICGVSASQEPADDAVTVAAPVSTATVW